MSPSKLTDTQLVLLSAAAQREDGAIDLAESPKGGLAKKAIGKLLTDGLVEEVPLAALCPPGAVTMTEDRWLCASRRARWQADVAVLAALALVRGF